MSDYTLRHDVETGRYQGVTRAVDGAQIPPDLHNRDYQAFLVWNAQQVPPLDLSDVPPLTDQQRRTLVGAAASVGVDRLGEEVVRLRALLRSAVDELNALRQWTIDLKSAVAAASSLAELKTAVAALSTLNPRTRAQVIQAVKDACSVEALE